MTALAIANIHIRQDADGRYLLSDLHRAAGGELRHRPSTWAQNAQTRALVDALNAEATAAGASRNSVTPLNRVNDGTANGTYVVRELVYAYAMWISPEFHLAVIRAYDAAQHAAPKVDPTTLSRRDLLKLALQAEEELAEARAAVAELQPKAAALDRIATARGSLCITDAAKHLGVPVRALFDWLKANGWTYRRPGGRDWLGYSHREQAGQIEHKTVTLQRTGINGEPIDRIATQVRITPKGLTAIARQMPGAREPATALESAA